MSAVDRFEEAFSYAWWLTGDDARAVTAARLAVEAVAEGEPLPLLTAVRSAAIDRPTMCPASEVALLHDGHLVDLPAAASLVQVDVADARTELAHGRLEALPDPPAVPFAHPERLGGLAVGNPADVAHARQCDSCGQVRTLLLRGREELRALPRPVPPAGAAAPAPAATAPAGVGGRDTSTAPSGVRHAGAAGADTPVREVPGVPESGVPESETLVGGERRPPSTPAADRRTGLIVALIVLAVVALFAVVIAASTRMPAGLERRAQGTALTGIGADGAAPATGLGLAGTLDVAAP